MARDTPVKLAGIAAIVGGLLRAAAVFAPAVLTGSSLSGLYFATDLFLVFGLIGVYASAREGLGAPGLVGFVLCMVGFLVIRTYGGSGGYMFGAGLVSSGLLFIAARLLAEGRFPRWIPLSWFVSFAAGLGTLHPWTAGPMLVVAGLSFSAGFLGAGRELARGVPD